MSAEAIIKRIKKDAEKEKKSIEQEAQKKIDKITSTIDQETEEMKQEILEKGQHEVDNIKRIEIAKAHQEAKRALLQTKERLINTCFDQALKKLKDMDDETYSTMVESLIKQGSDKIKGDFLIQTSKPIDETIAHKLDIPIKGTVDASGGVILISKDHSKIVDNTFEGILKRKKQDIRIEVGSILFD